MHIHIPEWTYLMMMLQFTSTGKDFICLRAIVLKSVIVLMHANDAMLNFKFLMLIKPFIKGARNMGQCSIAGRQLTRQV